MARSKEMAAPDPLAPTLDAEALAVPRIVRVAKLEEGEARGEGWVVLRSLLLVVGGLLLVSYLIFLR